MKLFSYLVLAGYLLLVAGCHKPSEIDIEKLNVLNSVYGDRYTFQVMPELYLYVTLKSNVEIDEEELKEIYKTFFFSKETNNKRKTYYVYLNFYDSNGKFQYQLSYDYNVKKFIRGRTEHY